MTRTRAADDAEVGKRARALTEQSLNICYRRTLPPGREMGQCWCYVLKEGDAPLPCPPPPVPVA